MGMKGHHLASDTYYLSDRLGEARTQSVAGRNKITLPCELLSSLSKDAKMKNNLDAGSYKTRRLNFCMRNKLNATWAFAGVLSITLLLFSLAGLLAVLNSSRALAAPSASYTTSATRGNLSTSTATAIATHGITATVPAAATQDSSSSQAPPTSSTGSAQNTSQDQQSSGFPMLTLGIGLAACITTISFLLVGWHFLRKKLLPVSSSKFPSSAAGPCSRVRTDTLPRNAYANGGFEHVGSIGLAPTNLSSWGQGAVSCTGNAARP